VVGQQYSTELHMYDNIVIQITKKKNYPAHLTMRQS